MMRVVATCCAVGMAMAQEQPKERRERVQEFHFEAFTPAAPVAGGAVNLDPSANIQFFASTPGGARTVAGVPYSAEGVTDYVRTLSDGTRITRRTVAKFARDGQGRTREEQTLPGLGPWASGDGAKMVTITDPVAREIYILNDKDKTARKIKLPAAAFSSPGPGSSRVEMRTERRVSVNYSGPGGETIAGGIAGAAVAIPDVVLQRGEAKTEQLGSQNMEGLQVTGTRTTRTVPAGQMGNDRPIVSTTERWESTELKTLVRSITHDPEFGDTTYRLTGISRAEPAKSLFQVPADYKLEDGPAHIRIMRSEIKPESK